MDPMTTAWYWLWEWRLAIPGIREAIKERQTPVVSKTEPDDVIDEDRDAARLELACVWG